MVVLAVLITQVSEDSRDGKADARLGTGLETARALYDDALATAPREAKRIAEAAGEPLQASDQPALQQLARTEEAGPAVVSVTITDADGKVLASAGSHQALAAGRATVRADGGEKVGVVGVTTLSSAGYLARVHELTSLDVALVADSGLIDSTLPLSAADLPAADGGRANLELGASGDEFRAAALALDGGPPGARIALAAPRESGFVASQPVIAGILLVFFAAAFFGIAILMRNLQVRITRILHAARRVGEGNYDEEVPVEGNDEMARLAVEFNKMSDRISEQVSQLKQQRKELEDSVHRIGEAFASGLDREALLEILVETAVAACSAEGGRVFLYDRAAGQEALTTEGLDSDLAEALSAAGEAAASAHGAGEAVEGARFAIGHAMVDRRERSRVLCTLAIARNDRPFSGEERQVLRYLIGQTAVSIENIGLHERVAEQAVTDGLTGIPNHRHFSEWMEREVARLDRFGGELSLVILDIDNFKSVNDRYGHLQGDRVLEELGRILRIESRGIDETARYGGEEFVLALPETGPEGAAEVAERLRRRIEGASVAAVDGGDPISVTASLGTATMPGDGRDVRSLIAAADAALYRAKRHGKNRVVSAVRDEVPLPQGNRDARRS